MRLIEKIMFWGRQQSFQPGPLAVFINPFFFIRRGLFKRIAQDAKELNGTLLDFGCGRKPYKNLFAVQRYIGVDIEQSGHSHKLSEVDVYYDGKNIPFADGHFDSVFCSEVFEHVFELDLIIKEINRVMKNDGKILITVPFAWNDHEVPYDFGRYSSFGLTYLLEKHGFKVIKISKTTSFTESIFQLWNVYIFEMIRTKSYVANTVLTCICISPFTIIGCLLSLLLPKRSDFYLNSVVLARKVITR